MWRRGRTANLRRRAEVRVQIRRMYPAENHGSPAWEETLKKRSPWEWADALRTRMKHGIQRFGRMFERG